MLTELYGTWPFDQHPAEQSLDCLTEFDNFWVQKDEWLFFMCGLNGIFAFNGSGGAPKQAELLATRDAMMVRGPDGAGEWWSEDRRLGLGHRRLSIVDLSERASQPMTSACGRYVVIFNGEIYNYPSLRNEIEGDGVTFQTTSDTEVLLHLFARDGAAMLNRLRGMFAFGIWDAHRRRLFIARDPYGIKPLYTSNDGWTFRFGSQVKALIAGGGVSREPEPAGLIGFHLWGSVPEPFTLYRDIRSLPAGHSQWIDEAGPREPVSYASVTKTFAEGANKPAPHSEIEQRVRAATRESVSAHLMADVEVGLFLSAGVDSGALLGLMRDAGQSRIKAITLTFEEFAGTADDEVPIASQAARIYGAEHIVRNVSRAEFRDDLPKILAAMDQPSIDGINSWFVSKAAKEVGLKVALSGVGGDELLAGYPSFRDVPRWTAWMKWLEFLPGARSVAQNLVRLLGLGEKHPKLPGLFRYGGDYAGAYLLRRSLFLPDELDDHLDPEIVRRGLLRLKPLQRLRASITPTPRNSAAVVAALESSHYLKNQLLRDADWAGMAHSLEIRTPLVDFSLLRALSPVTPLLKFQDGKRALGKAPNIPLPEAVVSRAKTGFSIPARQWSDRSSSNSRGKSSRMWAQAVLQHPDFCLRAGVDMPAPATVII